MVIGVSLGVSAGAEGRVPASHSPAPTQRVEWGRVSKNRAGEVASSWTPCVTMMIAVLVFNSRLLRHMAGRLDVGQESDGCWELVPAVVDITAPAQQHSTAEPSRLLGTGANRLFIARHRQAARKLRQQILINSTRESCNYTFPMEDHSHRGCI